MEIMQQHTLSHTGKLHLSSFSLVPNYPTHRSPPNDLPVNPTTKMATPRYLSSHLHPFKVHKDLHFRGSPLVGKPEVVDPRLLKNNLAATV